MGLLLECGRLVHPAVTSTVERAALARLIGVLLGAPILLALAAALPLAARIGANAAAAAMCVLLATSLLLVVVTAQSKKILAIGGTAIAAGAATVALVGWQLGLQGGLFILAAGLVIETYWVSRSGRTTSIAALLTAAASATAYFTAGQSAMEMQGMPWIAAAAYAATLAVRFSPNDVRDVPKQAADGMIDRLDGARLYLEQDGQLAMAGERVNDILGLAPDLLSGNAFFDRIRISDRVAYLCWVAKARGGEECAALELRLRLPGPHDQPQHKLVTLEFLGRNPDGQLDVLLRDASELGQLREDVDRTRDETAGLELAKSRFLASVSHELRTPLNAIIGFSDMLLHEAVSGPLPEKQREHVGLIREAGNHLLCVVNSILDISKIEAGTYSIRPEPFDLKQALELPTSMLEADAREKNLKVELKLPHGLGDVIADQRAIQQILINLLSNAVKFTPKGGTVTIAANREGSGVRLEVSDTGIGISEIDLANLGRPFMQVQNDYTRRYEGAGLGLSLVKGLVGLHGGSLSIESAPGLGTTVLVILPEAGTRDICGRHEQSEHEGQDDEAIRKIA